MLVNPDAYERVADFLEPSHFFDPLHQQIFETAGKLIAAGKSATPPTLRTYFEAAAPISADLTVPQYLGRLVAKSPRSSTLGTTVRPSTTWPSAET